MIRRQILVTVGLNKELTKDLPFIFAENEEQLQAISSELGRILEGDVCRLANGLVIITPLDR